MPAVDSITALRTLTGAENYVTVLGYHVPGDGGGGDFYWAPYSEDDEDSSKNDEDHGTVIKSNSDPTGRWKRLIQGPISVKWFGAKGNGKDDDQPAIQDALDTLKPGTNTPNRVITVPAGEYLLGDTLSPADSASNWQLVGEGTFATQFRWGGKRAPMIKLTNARCVVLRDFSLFGKDTDTAVSPTHGVLVHRGIGRLDSAPGYNVFERLFIGNASGETMTDGIAYTADQDANNEQGVFIDLKINVERYGLSFEHSNSLVHKIYGGDIGGRQAAINNLRVRGRHPSPDKETLKSPHWRPWGGQFVLFGTSLRTQPDGTIFRLGRSRHAISIVAASVESGGALLTTPEQIATTEEYPNDGAPAPISIIGGTFHVGALEQPEITYNAADGASLSISGADIIAPHGLTFAFGGKHGDSDVVLRDTALNLLHLEHHSNVLIDNCSNSAGEFNHSGNGRLTITNLRRHGDFG